MKKLYFVIFMMIFFVLVGCQKDKEVKVTFETNGGTAIGEVTSIEDLLEGIPSTTKAGYTFDGWFEDNALTESFDPLQERESWVFTLYAKWEANDKDYKVEHYQEGLDGVYVLFEDEDFVGVTDQVVTAIPKTYAGFTLDAEHGSAIQELTLPATGDAVLKLYYERNIYQVIIEESGGTAVNDLSVKYGDSFTLPTLTRFGYTFTSWTTYPATMPANNITVTASWTELPKYTVTFDAQGGSTVTTQSIYQGYLITEPTDPTRIGYAFDGWYIGTETTPFSFQTPVTQEMTLTAKWTPVLVNYSTEIYLQALDGNYVLSNTISLQALTESTANASAPSVDGFTENQTHTNRVISGTVLGDGSLVLKLYYTRNTYTIQFESNANLSIQSIEALYQANIVQPQDPIRSGYTFMGWYADQALTTAYAFTTMPLGGTTLYAKWQGQPTNLYFNSNGGSDVATLIAPLGGQITEPTAPTKEGYTFAGWYSNVGLTEAFTTWIMPSGGITLYAKWNPNLYTITFEENGGSLVTNITLGYGLSVSAPVSPTKTDYIFMGWCSDIELQQAYVFTTMPLNGTTLYAKWVSEEEGLTLAHIISMDYFTSVHVEGLIFLEASSPYLGFYLTDGTANIYVLYDQALVTDGLNYGFDAVLIYQQGIPMLAHVSNLEEITDTHVMTSATPSTIDEIKALDLEDPHPHMVELTGILLNEDGYMIADLVDGTRIKITNQFALGDTSLSLMNKVKVEAILHQYNNEWVIAVSDLEVIGMTDLEKVELIKSFIDAHYLDTYQGMDHFDLLMQDPWGFASIVMSFDALDEHLYDTEYAGFIAVTASEVVNINIEITMNSTLYTHTLILSLVPRVYHTVSDVLLGDIGTVYNLHGLIVMAHPYEGVYVIKDSTGTLFILGEMDVNYGDEIAIQVTKNSMSTMAFGHYDGSFMQVTSMNNVLNNDPQVMTVSELSLMTWTDQTIFSKYIEVKGFLSDEADLEYHEFYVIGNDVFQIRITPVSYSGYEALFEYAGLEIVLRGYIALDEDGVPMILFTGQRNDVQLPEYTDLERVEMILEVFSRTYANHTFTSFEQFIMYPNHPMLGGTITWNFIEGGMYYDETHQWFTYVDSPQTIKIELTITHHSASRTYVYQTTLQGPDVITIAEFKQLYSNEYAFVEGIVVYRNPERMYIQDETGLLLVDVYDCDAYKGDRVLVYGYVSSDYQYPNNLTLYYQRYEGGVDIPLIVHIFERDITTEMVSHPMSIEDAIDMDPDLSTSYNQAIEVSGYMTFDGWYFTLTDGGYSLQFEAVDEYTMHKLAMNQNTHVTITLMIEDYYNEEFEFIYLGIPGDVSERIYTLTEKQEILKSIVDDIWSEPIISGTSRTLPSSYTPFDATYTYDVPTEFESTFDLLFAYIHPVLEPVTIPLTVSITVDGVTIDHIINVSVLVGVTAETMTINEAKAHLNEIVTIEGQVYATFDYNYSYDGMLLYDGTDYLIVKLTQNDYIYSGSDIGRKVTLTGRMIYEQGRYTFETAKWGVKSYDAVPTLEAVLMPIETVVTLDHSHDDHLGEFVQVSGIVKRVGWDHYELIKGDSNVRIQTVYYGESSLEPFIGFNVILKGFIMGKTTYDNEEQTTVILGHAVYDGTQSVLLDEADDQVIAEKLVTYFMERRYDEPYYEGDQISLAITHQHFTSAIVTYTVLDHSELLIRYTYSYLVNHALVDTVIPIRLQVDYGTGSASYIFEVVVKGFTYNTLDDLFDPSVPFDDIQLQATVIDSTFDHAYFLINDEIYYYGGYLGMYSEEGSNVLLSGKKSMIDGEINYSYNVSYYSSSDYNEFTLIPRAITIEDIYETNFLVDDIRRDYLTVYGMLGYDPYLDYFYLDDMGMRIYIRHSLREYEPSALGSSILMKYDVSKNEIMSYLDDYIYMNVLFPNEIVLADYYLVDFVGTADDISLPEWTPAEKIEITKHKIDVRYDGLVYQPADYMEWMSYDEIQYTEITYSLVNPLSDAILLEDWNIQAMMVDTYTAVEILATVSIIDPDTSLEVTGTTTFTVYIEPIEMSSVREVLFGNIGEYYVTQGVIQFLYPENFMIIKDSSGLIFVELPMAYENPIVLEVGDEVKVLGMRRHYEYEDYVPVIGTAVDIEIISSDHAINRTAISMDVDDILALDYLDPDTFNQYISFDGTVIFSGNTWYPSYDVREDGYVDNKYDMQLWGDTYEPFNTMMHPKVGTEVVAYGYLIGFEYIYTQFDWIMYVTHIDNVIE